MTGGDGGGAASLPDIRRSSGQHEQPFSPTGRRRPGKPNILVIVADDLGWGDLGCYGSLHNSTPALDALAARGLRFRHAYSAAPTCSPTRVAFYTGRYPGRLPVGLQEPLRTRDEHHGIPADQPTLPSLLRDAGYDTAMFGKWHCGWLPWYSPLRIGFDTFFGNLDGVLDYHSHIDSTGAPDLYEGESPVQVEGYYTDILTERTVEHLQGRDRSQPFFVQVNYTAPHFPWEGRGDLETSEKVTKGVDASGMLSLLHLEGGSLKTYHEMVAAMDEGIGKILAEVEAQGQTDNTIVLFFSDNGGERFAFMWPFVGEKGDLEEGGIRVPCLVSWPAVLGHGEVSDVPVITMDWTATMLDAAGVDPGPSMSPDGQSLLPWLVEGNAAPDRPLVWRTRRQGAVRQGRYKMLHDRQARPTWHGDTDLVGSRTRLFDVADEGREKADLARELPDVTAQLLATFAQLDDDLLPYPTHAPGEAADAGVVVGPPD